MCNADVRNEIRQAGVKMWQVAEMFRGGMNDGNFSRKLRRELSKEDKAHIREIISLLSKGRVAK